jgi:hypothetical protein
MFHDKCEERSPLFGIYLSILWMMVNVETQTWCGFQGRQHPDKCRFSLGRIIRIPQRSERSDHKEGTEFHRGTAIEFTTHSQLTTSITLLNAMN